MSSQKVYITATEPHSGKSLALLGMMQILLRQVRNVAFFKPIINLSSEGTVDYDVEMVLKYFHLDTPLEASYAYTLEEARALIHAGKHTELLEGIMQKYKALEAGHSFILCAGTDISGTEAAFEFELNTEIAAALDCPILLVMNGMTRTSQELTVVAPSAVRMFEEKGLDVAGLILNRVTLTADEQTQIINRLATRATDKPALLYTLPNLPDLDRPTMQEICDCLGANILYGADRMDTPVHDFLLAAGQPDTVLSDMADGQLIITPSDRHDIILAALTSRQCSTCPDVAGLLLTTAQNLPESITRLMSHWTGPQMPVLSVKTHTEKALQALYAQHCHLNAKNLQKINMALALFEQHVDTETLSARVINRCSVRITPMQFEFTLIERARHHAMRIVLAEGEEERILRATEIISRRGIADITLLGDPERIATRVREFGIDLGNVSIFKPERHPLFEEYVQTYFNLRKAKGVSEEQARVRMADPSYFATMMVHKDAADGMVSGSVNTTAHTIRPAFEFIKAKPGFSIVSSVFLMCLKDRVLVFGDCAVNPNPSSAELAEIAINSAQTARIFGIEPRVAMLSYSTGKSGKGADVDSVLEACRIAKERAPELLIEGPIQYDAAIDPEVARTKMPDSPVAGHATVFIFPDLNTGNNTYKAVQRAASALAIGPVLQGLNKPVNDLSRGCTIPDIVNTVAITAIQAQAIKGLI